MSLEMDQSDLSPGAHVCGDYVIERRLRLGPGVGVYTARRAGHPSVRFSVWHVRGAATTDPAAIRRFQRAIEQIRSLTLQSIPAVVAATVAPVGPVIVTEHVAGISLRDRMVGGRRLKRPEVIRVVRHMATVVDELRGCEPAVTHGALCPEHVRVQPPEGPVWVEGCGFVHALATAGLLEEPASAFVEQEYLAPGAMRRHALARVDLWSLATITFEMLTGLRPFAGASAEEIEQLALHGPLPSVCSLRPEISPETDALLVRAWSLRADGFVTAWAFARDLSEALNAVPIGGAESYRPPTLGSSRPSAGAGQGTRDFSVVSPSPEVLAVVVPRALPNEAEIDQAFDAMFSVDGAVEISGLRSPPAVRDVTPTDGPSDPDDDPTALFRLRAQPQPPEHDAEDPGERQTIPHTDAFPSYRPPSLAPGSVVRATTHSRTDSQRPPPSVSGAVMRAATPAPGTPRVDSNRPPPMSAGPSVRAPTPPRGVVSAMRAPTPGTGAPARASVLRTPTLPGVRGLSVPAPNQGGPVSAPGVVATATPVVRAGGPTPSRGMPASVTPATVQKAPSTAMVRVEGGADTREALPRGPGPSAGPEGYGAFLEKRNSDEGTSSRDPSQRPPNPNRAAVILGVSVVVAAVIYTAGQLYLARLGPVATSRAVVPVAPRAEGPAPRPSVPRDGSVEDSSVAARSTTSAGGPRPEHPSPEDMASAMERLAPLVRQCVPLELRERQREALRLSVWFDGASGRADRVHVWGPLARPPEGECIQGAVRGLALPVFRMRSWPADFSVPLR